MTLSVGPAFGSWPEATSNDVTVDVAARYNLCYSLGNGFSFSVEPEVAFLNNSYAVNPLVNKNWALFVGTHLSANYKVTPDFMLSFGIGGLLSTFSHHTEYALDGNGNEIDGSRTDDGVNFMSSSSMGLGKYSVQFEAKYHVGKDIFCSLLVRELTSHTFRPVSTLVLVGVGYCFSL